MADLTVVVAKDRLLDTIATFTGGRYYGDLTQAEQDYLRKAGRLLALPDDSPEALPLAKELDLVNGEEYLYAEGK